MDFNSKILPPKKNISRCERMTENQSKEWLEIKAKNDWKSKQRM